MSSAIEDEEADLRDGLRGLPFGRIMLEDEAERWTGGLAHLAWVTVAGEEGEAEGKGMGGRSTCVSDEGGLGGGEGGGECSCCSWSSSFGIWKRDFFVFGLLGRALRGAKAPGPRSLEKVTGERDAT